MSERPGYCACGHDLGDTPCMVHGGICRQCERVIDMSDADGDETICADCEADELRTEVARLQGECERLRDGLLRQSASLSRISYLCGEPNEMQVSVYDVPARGPDPRDWHSTASEERYERERVYDGPWRCSDCGHEHRGARFANICIGCPCPWTGPGDAGGGGTPEEAVAAADERRGK